MGFLKDLKKLKEVGDEVVATHKVKGSLAEAQHQMAAATAAMQAAAGTGDLAEHGGRATAQVLATRATTMLVNHAPMLEIDLMVFRRGNPPLPGHDCRVRQESRRPASRWACWSMPKIRPW